MRQGLHCNVCNTTIVSMHRHDFKYCNCSPDSDTYVYVDGGTDYFRCGWKHGADFEIAEVDE